MINLPRFPGSEQFYATWSTPPPEPEQPPAAPPSIPPPPPFPAPPPAPVNGPDDLGDIHAEPIPSHFNPADYPAEPIPNVAPGYVPQYEPLVERWRGLASSTMPPELAGRPDAGQLLDKYLYAIKGESSGEPTAQNPTSTAHGLVGNLRERTDDPETQLRNGWGLVASDLQNGGTGFGDWGEGRLYQGQPFGSLGENPYPGTGGGDSSGVSAPPNNGGLSPGATPALDAYAARLRLGTADLYSGDTGGVTTPSDPTQPDVPEPPPYAAPPTPEQIAQKAADKLPSTSTWSAPPVSEPDLTTLEEQRTDGGNATEEMDRQYSRAEGQQEANAVTGQGQQMAQAPEYSGVGTPNVGETPNVDAPYGSPRAALEGERNGESQYGTILDTHRLIAAAMVAPNAFPEVLASQIAAAAAHGIGAPEIVQDILGMVPFVAGGEASVLTKTAEAVGAGTFMYGGKRLDEMAGTDNLTPIGGPFALGGMALGGNLGAKLAESETAATAVDRIQREADSVIRGALPEPLTVGETAYSANMPFGGGGDLERQMREQMDADQAAERAGKPLPGQGGLFGGTVDEQGTLPDVPRIDQSGGAPVTPNGYVRTLRPWADVADEVTTRSDLPGVRQAQTVLAKVGINPSLANDTEVGQAITTYARQRISGEQLADTAVTAALDPHAAPLTGSMARAAPIDREGIMAVPKADGSVEHTPWQDVFSRSGDYDLTPHQQAYIRDFHAIIDQGSAMLEEAGIKVPKLDGEEGWSYVPRQVEGVRGVEVTRSSNPFVQRLYETAQEGADNGIKYSSDPRKTAELYLKAAYREVADEQLSAALEKQSVTAKELVPQAVKDRLVKAIDDRMTAERASRVEGAQTQRLYQQMAGSDTHTADVELQAARRQQARIEGELAGRSQIQGRVANRLEAHAEPISREGVQAAKGDLADATSTLSRYHEIAQDEIDSAQRELRLAQNAEARLKGVNAGQGVSAKINANPLGNEKRLRDLQDAASRVDEAKQALADAEKRRERFINIAEDTQRITSREAFAQERGTARTTGEQAGVNSMQSLTRTPLSYGERLTAAKARVEAAREAMVDASGATSLVPRGEAGAKRLVSTETAAEEQAAKAEYTAAKQAYSKSMEAARARTVAPASLFDADAEGEIPVAQWRNRFYPKGDADALKTAMDSFSSEGTNPVTKALGQAVNLTRFGGTMADFGSAPFIQGLPTLARNPVAWAKATALHYETLLNPRAYSAYVRANLEIFQTMAAHGVPIGDTEFFRAAEAGHGIPLGAPLELLPGGESLRAGAQGIGQQTVGRSRSAFNTFLGVARSELWKSQEDHMNPDQLARWVRNMTGGLDSRALGVGPNQRAVEGTWLAFSPKLMRSTVGLMADAMNPTTQSGRQSLRTLAQLAGAATAVYYAAGKAMGKPDDEIEQGLNPLNGKKFLSYHVGEQWVGIGGQIRAITQLVANGVADPKSLASLGQDNPLINYFLSHAGPGYQQASQFIDLASGGATHLDPYDHNDNVGDFAKSAGKSLLPFGLRDVVEGHPGVGLASSVGLRASPETPTDARDALTQKMFVRDPQTGTIRPRQPSDGDAAGVLNYKDLPLQSQKDVINSQGRVTDLQAEKGPSDLKVKTDAIKAEYDQKEADQISAFQTGHLQIKTLPEQWNDISQQRRAAEEEFQRENATTLNGIPSSRIESVTQGYYAQTVNAVDPTTGKVTGIDFDATRAKQLDFINSLSTQVKDGASDRQIMDDWLTRTEGQKTPEHKQYDSDIKDKEAAGFFALDPSSPEYTKQVAALYALHPDLDAADAFWKGGVAGKDSPDVHSAAAVDIALKLAATLPTKRDVRIEGLARPVNQDASSLAAWKDTESLVGKWLDGSAYVKAYGDQEARKEFQNHLVSAPTFANLKPPEQAKVRTAILENVHVGTPQLDAALAWWGHGGSTAPDGEKFYLVHSDAAVKEVQALYAKYGKAPAKTGYAISRSKN